MKLFLASAFDKTFQLLPENDTPILFLNDNHAVWVENDKLEILEAA